MKKMDLYWASNPEWYDFTDEDEPKLFLTEKAPPEARKSFERYLEQRKSNAV